MELWPRRSALDEDAAGREEERLLAAVLGGIRRPELAGWVRKELEKLGQALLRQQRR